MTLSQRSLETLVALLQIKLASIEVFDREDARELANLEHCLRELRTMSGGKKAASAPVIDFPQPVRTRRRASA